MQKNDCQMRSLIKGAIFGRGISRGEIFWVDAERARWLVDEKIAEPILIGPKETKPAEPAEKKSYPAATTGPLTDSVQSIESGPALSSASAAGQASPEPTATVFRKRGRPRKSE